MADHSEAIRTLEEALASGVRSVSIEGTQHAYASTDEMRDALAYFRARDDATAKAGKRRATFNRLRIF